MVQLWNGEAAQWRVELRTSEPALSVKTSETGRTLILGLGETPGTETVRRAAAKAVKSIRPLGAESALLDAAEVAAALGAEGLFALAQGAGLAQYQQAVWKKREDKPFALYLTGTEGVDGETVLAEARALVKATCLARDLVNCPSNILTPAELARRAVEAAEAVGIETQVVDEAEAGALGMGAFLAVGRSSANRPKLVILRYRGGQPDQAPIALVGKGVCHDTGGYSLKARTSLRAARGDMAGGAAVLGAIVTLAANKVPVNVTALIPAVENRISPDSFLPGHVITSMSGRTIEIGSSDAEGRLILADAITYALEKEGAAKIVDIATLTGSMANMFGGVATGYLCNDEDLNGALLAAAERSGEKFWRCPTFPEYRRMIDSPIAELYNSSEGCGAICAGLFVGEFAGDTPWLHLDIAGTASTRSPIREYHAQGATGVCVSTLYELCKGYV